MKLKGHESDKRKDERQQIRVNFQQEAMNLQR